MRQLGLMGERVFELQNLKTFSLKYRDFEL